MIEMYKDTKIFVACPANVSTGGPESLHQLAYHLRKDLNINAYIYYYNFDNRRFETPVHPEYQIYGNPCVIKLNEIEDNEKNIIIVPEVQEGLNLLQLFKNIRKGVWFLSVDYYYLSKFYEKMLFLDFNKLDLLSNKIEKLAKKFPYEKDPLLKLADFYMTTSHRGLKWFSDLKPMFYLKRPINKAFIENSTKFSKKENIVAYNPKKGFSFTKKIIKFAKDIIFVPIDNMTREEVINLLKKSKVYIDFGYFPGPERMPKEAAILGCCVITGKRGCAAFFEDVPIPDEYKFEDIEENIPKIVDKIKDCLENYEERYKDFENYREIIKNGPKEFIEDLRKTFVKV
jgi:hypothetical protein